jgi:hypothetical protein
VSEFIISTDVLDQLLAFSPPNISGVSQVAVLSAEFQTAILKLLLA